MKIALYLPAALVVLIALMGIIGALLPRNHTATRQAVFKEKPDALYAVVNNWAAHASWRTGLTAVVMLPAQNGLVSFREDSNRRSISYVVVESVPGKKLVAKIADENLPFGGTWTYEFSSNAAGGNLRITEDGEVQNVFFRFLARFFFSNTASMETYLRDLGNKFGETVDPQA